MLRVVLITAAPAAYAIEATKMKVIGKFPYNLFGDMYVLRNGSDGHSFIQVERSAIFDKTEESTNEKPSRDLPEKAQMTDGAEDKKEDEHTEHASRKKLDEHDTQQTDVVESPGDEGTALFKDGDNIVQQSPEASRKILEATHDQTRPGEALESCSDVSNNVHHIQSEEKFSREMFPETNLSDSGTENAGRQREFIVSEDIDHIDEATVYEESSSEPSANNGNSEVHPTDNLSESTQSSAPPMCQPLPSGKLMNVQDPENDDASTITDGDDVVSGKLSDVCSTPPMKGRIQKETDSECRRGIVGIDQKSEASGLTGKTRHEIDKFMAEDIAVENRNYSGESLLIAAELNDVRAVERILNLPNTDVNAVDENGKTALHIASEYGFDDVVKRIFAHRGIIIDKQDNRGKFPLIVACENNHPEVVKLLSGRPDMKSWCVEYCLYIACCMQVAEVVKVLLEHPRINVNVGNTTDDGVTAAIDTPLQSAVQSGNLEIVNLLLERDEIQVNKTVTDGITPLYMACQQGHLEIVEKLLQRNNIEVNKASSDNGATPFWKACQGGHLEIVKKLLERNEIDVNKAIDTAATPLLVACYQNHLAIVEKLLERNEIYVNKAPGDGGQTPLYMACYHGHLEIVEKLLQRSEIIINKAHKDGTTPLDVAISEGHVEIVEVLVKHLAGEVDDPIFFEFDCALRKGDSEAVQQLLERNEIDVNMADNNGIPPLFIVCKSGYLEIVEKLLERNEIEVNQAGSDGVTPLLAACEEGHLEIVKKLLGRNAIEVNKARTDDGRTPLHQACSQGYLEIVEKLLEQSEIEVNKARTDDGQTPLFAACIQGHSEIVEKFLERNEIEVNKACTDDGSTPLYIACQNGHLEIVEKLLERNEIEVNKAATDDGRTPLYVACGQGHLEIVQKLLERNEVEVNVARIDGCTPLYNVCVQQMKTKSNIYLEIIKELLKHKEIDVNKPFIKTGDTPLTVASLGGSVDIVKLLLEHPGTDCLHTDEYGRSALDKATRNRHTAIVELLRNHTAARQDDQSSSTTTN